LHLWRYYDLKQQRIIDNRYLVANLIACEQDTQRVVDPEVFSSVFDLQEKVIEDIISSVDQQRALETAPRSVDPIQQTVATMLQSYLNHPDIDRRKAIEAIRSLNQPMLAVQVRELRKAQKAFQTRPDPRELLGTVQRLLEAFSYGSTAAGVDSATQSVALSRDDLRLICFELISGG
jgi:hypothetical protein